MTTPNGGPAPAGSPRRAPVWVLLGLPAVLLGLLAVAVVAYASGDGRRAADRQPRPVPTGSDVPSSALAGDWSGEGSLRRCAGLDDGCPETLEVSLTIVCSRQPCVVTPFDASYGSPPLRFEGGRYLVTGPVPPELAPTCGGAPTRSAVWRLEVAVVDGRMVGSYAESTIQGFDCGATGVAWDVVLERS